MSAEHLDRRRATDLARPPLCRSQVGPRWIELLQKVAVAFLRGGPRQFVAADPPDQDARMVAQGANLVNEVGREKLDVLFASGRAVGVIVLRFAEKMIPLPLA